MFQELQSIIDRVGYTLESEYTCPANKRLIIKAVTATGLTNTGSSSGSVYVRKSGSGVDSLISNSIPISLGSTSNLLPNIQIMGAGDIIKVVSNQDTVKLPITSTLQATDGSLITFTNIKVVNSIVVAIGYYNSGNGAVMFQSTDNGVSWSMVTMTGLPTSCQLADIDYGGGTYTMIASNDTTKVYTATTLTTWTQRTTGLTLTNPFCIKFANSLWALGSDTGISKTADPTATWTTTYTTNPIRALDYFNSVWGAITTNTTNQLTTSPDAITWTDRTPLTAGNTAISLVNDGTRQWIFATGLSPKYSTNGTTFNNANGVFSGFPTVTGTTFKQVVFHNSKIVWLGASSIESTTGTIYESASVADNSEGVINYMPKGSVLNPSPYVKLVSSGTSLIFLDTSVTGNGRVGYVTSYSKATTGQNTLGIAISYAEITL